VERAYRPKSVDTGRQRAAKLVPPRLNLNAKEDTANSNSQNQISKCPAGLEAPCLKFGIAHRRKDWMKEGHVK
jgi:hypothetical protein